MFTKRNENILFYLCCIIVLPTLFLIYSNIGQKYVGACDWYGYYQESVLIRSGQVNMPTAIPASKYPSIAPLSYFEKNGKVLPQYTPGFPILLAIGGLFGLEFYVNPLIGILSIIVLYLTIKFFTGNRWIAGFFGLLWGLSPVVVSGSTYLMSDLSSALFILLGFYLFKTKKTALSGIALAFSCAIRPINALFCLLMLILLFKEEHAWKERLRFLISFAIPAALYGIYNWYVYGAPWKTGYVSIFFDLSTSIFTEHLGYYCRETILQFSPIPVLLAFIAIFKREKNWMFLSTWFLVFFIFYCFWVPGGGNVWWWIRFILAGIPALLILAALGLNYLVNIIQTRPRMLKTAVSIPLAIILMLLPVYYVHRGTGYSELWTKGKAQFFYDISKKVSTLVPAGHLVGALEFSGVLRLYGNIESFCTIHMNSLVLISDQLKEKKTVYLLVEPWTKDSVVVKKIFENFTLEITAKLDTFENFFLYKVTGQKQKDLILL